MGGVEYAVRQIPSFYKYKNEWMNRNADRVETLIYGSSHGMNGINPSYIDGLAFNLGLMSQSLKYDAFLPSVIQDMIQIKEVRQESFSKYGACRRFG